MQTLASSTSPLCARSMQQQVASSHDWLLQRQTPGLIATYESANSCFSICVCFATHLVHAAHILRHMQLLMIIATSVLPQDEQMLAVFVPIEFILLTL